MTGEPSLICFDLDGTVYRDGIHRLTERVERALRCAHERGIPTCVVSGRPWPMIDARLRRAPWLDWLVTVNGASVWRRSPRELVCTRPIGRELALRMVDELADLGTSWFLFSNTGEFFEPGGATYLFGRWERIAGKFMRHLPTWLFTPITRTKGFSLTPSVRDKLLSMDEGPTKLNCNFAGGVNVDEGVSRLKALGGLEVVRMWYGELEITAQGVTKGSAIDELCERAGIDRSRTVMFGDSANDLPCVGHVGSFVAVDNASDEVKAAANEICPSVYDDGVAVWIERALGL